MIEAHITRCHPLPMVLAISGVSIMNRLLTTGAALSVLLGTTGLALAQGYNAGPSYPTAPAYGQPVPPQAQTQPYGWQAAPASDPHSGGTAGRAYYNGQKSN